MSTDTARAVLHLWRTTLLPQVEIAIRVGCSPSYVQKLVAGRGTRWQRGTPIARDGFKATTPEAVVEAYFTYPDHGPQHLAMKIHADPLFVLEVCKEKQLPFKGLRFDEIKK